MNGNYFRAPRSLTICAIAVIGLATTIATGGGSGSIAPPPPPPPTGPTLAITVDNAHDVATALITGIGLSFDVGDVSGGEVTAETGGELGGGAGGMLKLSRLGELAAKPSAAAAGKLESCLVSGTVDVTVNLADPATLSVGDRITAVFSDCDDGDGYTVSGTFDLTVADIQGDLFTEVFLLALDVVLTDVEVTEGNRTVTADGDFTLTLDSLDFPVIRQRLAGDELRLESLDETVTFTDFDHYIEVDIGMNPEPLLVEVLGRLDSRLLGGSVDYETPLAVQATGDNDPYTGEILITGADDSNVRIVIVDSNNVTLEVDTNGDGVVDEFIDTNFAALNGHTSAINSSTAPILAREVITGVSGFGSLAVTAGSQFVPAAPFGQLQLQAVTGDFTQIDIACLVNGSASISGFIGTAGTYGADDMLLATFNACSRGGEILNGPMDIAVTSFAATPGDAYLFTGSVAQDGLERDAGGITISGTGSFDTSYDFRFTTQGFVYMSASATSFSVEVDGVVRQLAGPNVNAEIVAGAPPVQVTRTSFGALTSPLLDGSVDYQSIVPDTFLFDDSPDTGPFSGELLVAASDGSTLRIVAIDDTNVRLEIDRDGDSVVDNEIVTTWAALQ